MSLFVMDTDHFTLLRFGNEKIVGRVRSTDPANLATTVITIEEVLTGWYTQVRKARDEDRLALAYDGLWENIEFLKNIRVLPFLRPAIERYTLLRKVHRRLGRMDLAIAAIVLEENATLATRNRQDFEQIEGLVI